MKNRDAIPRSWLTRCVKTVEDGLGHAILCADSVHQRQVIRDKFSNFWSAFSSANQVVETDALYWFESTSKTHAGLALVRNEVIIAYKVLDARTL